MSFSGGSLVLSVLLLVSAKAHQEGNISLSASPPTAPKQYSGNATRPLPPDALPSGTTFRVQLIDSLSAKKARAGKKFKANIVGTIPGMEPFLIKDFSRVIGHVTQVQKRDQLHPESHLQVMFDKVKFKHGKEASFKGIVTSVVILTERSLMKQFDRQLGYDVDVTAPDDSGDILSLSNYSFPESQDGTGVIISSTKQTVYISWHTVLTIKVE